MQSKFIYPNIFKCFPHLSLPRLYLEILCSLFCSCPRSCFRFSNFVFCFFVFRFSSLGFRFSFFVFRFSFFVFSFSFSCSHFLFRSRFCSCSRSRLCTCSCSPLPCPCCHQITRTNVISPEVFIDSPLFYFTYELYMRFAPNILNYFLTRKQFKTINYAYSQQTLKDFTLKIPSGRKVAVVGESGVGKSTIMKLIQRYYDPLEGSVSMTLFKNVFTLV